MGVDERKAKHHGVNLGENVANGPKITEGFAHLFPVNVDKAIVKPMVNNGRVPGMALSLTDFCLVVGES